MIIFEQLGKSASEVWLTSDTHYSHKNIVKGISVWNEESKKGCRDFNSLEEMNDIIVSGINNNVREDDILIHCGDWSFGGIDMIKTFLDKINCKNIYLIQGNHDHHLSESFAKSIGFKSCERLGYYKVDEHELFCSHYPNVSWHNSGKGAINIHGHVHNTYTHPGNSLDVGIDSIYAKFGEYRPITVKEAIDYIASK